MLSVSEAIARVESVCQPVTAEVVALTAAVGRVLTEPVPARIDHPPADVSAMDGYAVRAADAEIAPTTLDVIGESAAGRAFPRTIGNGEAVRIFTGAAVPTGADAIVIQEHATRDGDRVTLQRAAHQGAHIRPRGQDFTTGDVLLQPGRRLTERDVSLAAAMDVPWLMVRSRPRVAILATGDELVLPGGSPSAQQIVNSASFLVAGYIRRFGGEPLLLPLVRDDTEAIVTAIEQARTCDLLVSIGGASVGDHDLMGAALQRVNYRPLFEKVAMRPGKPVLCGVLGTMPVIGLPGNLVSAAVTTLLFVRAAIATMLRLNVAIGRIVARLGCDLPGNDHREHYLRARLSHLPDGSIVATPFATQDSSMARILAEADGLLVRPPHAAPARAGEPASALLFPDSTCPEGVTNNAGCETT